MKHIFTVPVLLCLVIGILLGGLLPMPWDEEELPGPSAAVSGVLTPPGIPDASGNKQETSSSAPAEPLDSLDNFPLLNAACAVNRALKEQDYATVAAFVHPQKGVTFTPYSTVDFETDLTFTAAQIKQLAADDTVYTWGSVDGRGSLIELTMSQYFQQYVYNMDYTQAPQIGVDRIMTSGNALENLTEAYPGCRFVDFCFPGLEPANQGLDWCSLKLAFEASESGWLLVGIIHGQWTV